MGNNSSDSILDENTSLAGQITSDTTVNVIPDSSADHPDTDIAAAPSTRDTISPIGGSVHSTGGTDLSNGGSVPSTEGTNLSNEGTVPSTEYTAPSTGTTGDTAPSTEETVPQVQRDGYIKGMNVKVRSTPDTESDNILASLDRGDIIGCISETNGWTSILYEGRLAYVFSAYVSYEPIAAETEPLPAEDELPSYERDYGDGAKIGLSSSWTYAGNSVINSGYATFYQAKENRNGITVCVNAGHGTSGVNGRKTLCHPDGTPKVTGGTTQEGAVKAIAISTGMDFNDGTPESKVTLAMAKVLKTKLLDSGYDVLMIRETNDVQLDNIARTVIANNNADCHIALHWDSTSSDKGAFYMSVPSSRSYRSMEPVAHNWEKHERLGGSLISGLRNAGVKIYSGGSIEMDLTQTSYSTIPSVDIELGDAASSHSDSTLDQLGDGLLMGVNIFFGMN